MKPTTFLILGLLFCANSASALSCAKVELGNMFNKISKSSDRYVLGVGRLNFSEKMSNEKMSNETAQSLIIIEQTPYSIKASFTGQFMGDNGLGTAKTVPVTVRVECMSMWCGEIPSTEETLVVFLKKSLSGYQLRLGACDGDYKTAPTPKEIDFLHTCFKEKKCSAPL